MSDYSEALEGLEKLKERARLLAGTEAEVRELQGTLARARVLLIQLEGALSPVVKALPLEEQLKVSVPFSGLLNLLVGVAPRVSSTGRLGKLALVKP